MTKNEFLLLLRKSSMYSFDFAKRYVTDELPNDFRYSICLNVSYDEPNLTQFDLYPKDDNKKFKLIDENEVVELLCRKDKVPVWIDISVESVYKDKTILSLYCAGRYSDNENEFYYIKQGTGPFGIKGPIFPIGYKEGQKFKLKNNYRKSFLTLLKYWLQ
ncbi:hypothetical protein [Chryseobacterium turcicum]|uniref:Uncharacterized protein n=1 Tax=Chryseobacterium turcicum TaxID=2898076 RepID=A0A9Q3YZA1_9FLAO|nr:hypothetical protein [Chryseobacterium turcicum]MCD1117960.1 hypothetical protein [Chryseobacterium turcicum]